jgi:hypothetical protein
VAVSAATALGAVPPPPAAALGATSYGPAAVTEMRKARETAEQQKEATDKPIREQTDTDVKKAKTQYDRVASDYAPVEVTKPPPVPVNDPLQGFASAAGVFAMLASALTHTPAINAMNGMASAINATKANDWKAYEEGYKQWKENTDLALKKHQMQAEDMKLALETMQTDLSLGKAKLDAANAVYDDRVSTKAAELGDLVQLDQIQTSRALAAASMAEHQARITAMGPELALARAEKEAIAQGTPEALSKFNDFKTALTGTPEQREYIDQVKANMDAGMPRAAAELKAQTDIATAKVSAADRPGSADWQMRTLVGDYMAHGMSQAEAVLKAKQEISKAAGSAKPSPADKWTLLTDPENGQQYLQSVGRDGTVRNQTVDGQPYHPSGAVQVGKEDAPVVAARKQASDDERARHNEAVEAIQNNRLLTQDARSKRLDEENQRHHKASEDEAGGAQGIAVRKFIDENPNATAQDIQKFVAGMKPTAGGVAGKQLDDVKADVKREHPEYTEGQADTAANNIIAVSKKVPGTSMTAFVAEHAANYEKTFTAQNGRPPTPEELGNYVATAQGKQSLNANQLNLLEDRAQQFKLALDNVQKIKELLPKAVAIATRLGQPLEKIEAVGNMLGTDSSTDRADFQTALAFLRTNAPLLLKQANPTSRAIGGDQAMVEKIIRGENWGDSRLNVESAMNNLDSIFQQDLSIMQNQAKRSGRTLNLPGLTAPLPGQTSAPAASTAPSAPPPWETDPDAK